MIDCDFGFWATYIAHPRYPTPLTFIPLKSLVSTWLWLPPLQQNLVSNIRSPSDALTSQILQCFISHQLVIPASMVGTHTVHVWVSLPNRGRNNDFWCVGLILWYPCITVVSMPSCRSVPSTPQHHHTKHQAPWSRHHCRQEVSAFCQTPHLHPSCLAPAKQCVFRSIFQIASASKRCGDAFAERGSWFYWLNLFVNDVWAIRNQATEDDWISRVFDDKTIDIKSRMRLQV